MTLFEPRQVLTEAALRGLSDVPLGSNLFTPLTNFMSYLVLARKLRPKVFQDLLGQEATAQILQNAILQNRVAHAFLFAGSRGVGKTSTARILTKALNCENPQEANPCNVCSICVEIEQNASPDIYEIDAASNRGVENIRELRSHLKYKPARCKQKVYIIDEAHMLTLESFNALLKTLEEPPEHVKFILATTDPHKLPSTVVSRCQRYDFLKVPHDKMASYLTKVAGEENIEISQTVIDAIVKKATGGMRDALTALDQIRNYAGAAQTDTEILSILGIIEDQASFDLLKAIWNKDAVKAVALLNDIRNHGHDLQDIHSELLRLVKNFTLVQIMLAQHAELPPTLFQEVSLSEIDFFKQYVTQITANEAQQAFYILLELEKNLKQSAWAQICFEMAILQMVSISSLVGIPELLQSVKNLATSQNTLDSASLAIRNIKEQNSKKKKLTPNLEPSIKTPEQKLTEPAEKQPVSNQTKQEIAPLVYPPPVKTPEQKLTEPAEKQSQNGEIEKKNLSKIAQNSDTLPQVNFKTPQFWEQLVDLTHKQSQRVASFLRQSLWEWKTDTLLIVYFSSEGVIEMMPEHSEFLVMRIIREHFPHAPAIQVEFVEGTPNDEQKSIAQQDRETKEREKQLAKQELMNHPHVQTIFKHFPDSEIINVKLGKSKKQSQ